ncbi:MAG: phosphoribosylanthranilate isomerase [Bacillota bacterium]
MVWVKICGIQDVETALFAARAGADALGFVFAASPRRVTPAQVRTIGQALPPAVMKIGVFVDAPLEQLQEIVYFCRLDAVQLHGSESPEYCRRTGAPVIKAFRVGKGNFLPVLNNYDVTAVLLDTYVPGSAGGTGQCFDWRITRELRSDKRIILAGGLNPQNVREAIRTALPYGVDASSGVETDGRKDKEKIREFIKKAKEV